MTIEIWTSLYANPRYTDEPGCSYHGELNIQMPDTTGGKKREIGVKMIMTITLTQTSFVYINKILKKYYTYGASLPYNK
jgi:hypothetical protein